ncbi:hypothetical protein [Paenibacillus odorifer]|uniref:hypothetical protein n=1 Tax=Paenibacillus odorifer TaxID=189426 RepID=UPI00096CBF06|nr:hypothetical protein [Paenibacillus odorifer]OME23388.1 hypothetical protein BSK57_16380 [Paenibacillus odorifer]
MPNVTYKSISPVEALFLFRMMEESKSFAIMGFHITNPGKPQPYDFSESLFSTPYGAVRTESVDETIVVYVGEMEIGFDISEVTFSRHISDFRIEVWASTELYTATFESGDMEDEYLDKARKYKIHENADMKIELNECEDALIKFIRTLDFGVLLHATTALREKAIEVKNAGKIAEHRYGDGRERGFRECADSIKILTELLGDANADYRDHIYPEDKAHE